MFSSLWGACERLQPMRRALQVLSDDSQRKKQRTDALAAIQSSLRTRQVCSALTLCTRREAARCARDPQVDLGQLEPLSWTELVAELLDALARAAEDVRSARSASATIRGEYMRCFRTAVKLTLTHAPAGTLAEVVLGFLKYAATWISEPKLIAIMDDAWQCVQDFLEVPALRAIITHAYYRFWVDACFQQLAQLGALFRKSIAATNAARRLFVLLGSETPTNSILQLKAMNSSKVSKNGTVESAAAVSGLMSSQGHDSIAYSFILQRACVLLYLSKRRTPKNQRETESCALACIAAVLEDRGIDLYASSAIREITKLAMSAAIACWSERRHRPHALAFVRAMVRYVEHDSAEMIAVRARVLDDFCSFDGVVLGRVSNVPQDPEVELVDIASIVFPMATVLALVDSSSSSLTVSSASAWLRVMYHSLMRRSNEAVMHVLHVVHSVVSIFNKVAGETGALPPECAQHACEVLNEACRIYSCIMKGSSSALRRLERLFEMKQSTVPSLHVIDFENPRKIWRGAYNCLIQQLTRGRMAGGRHERANRSGPGFRGRMLSAEESVLRSLNLLVTLAVVDSTDIATGSAGTGKRSPLGSVVSESVWSLPLFDAPAHTTSAALSFLRSHIAVSGFPEDDSNVRRSKLLFLLSTICDPLALGDNAVERGLVGRNLGYAIGDAASSALGLVYGSCLPSAHSSKPGHIFAVDENRITRAGLKVFDAFNALFGESDHESEGQKAVILGSLFDGSRVDLENALFAAGEGSFASPFLESPLMVVPSERGTVKYTLAPRVLLSGTTRFALEEVIAHRLVQRCGSFDDFRREHIVEARRIEGSTEIYGPARADNNQMRSGKDQCTLSSPGSTGNLRDSERITVADMISTLEQECDDFMHGDKQNDSRPHRAEPLVSVTSVVTAARVVAFLGEYLAEGITLGYIDARVQRKRDAPIASEATLGLILLHVTSRLRASRVDFLLSSEAHLITSAALSACAKTVEATRTRIGTKLFPSNSIYGVLSQHLSSVLEKLVALILDNVGTALNLWVADLMDVTRHAFGPIQSLVERGGGPVHGKRYREGRSHENANPSKRSRFSHDILIDDINGNIASKRDQSPLRSTKCDEFDDGLFRSDEDDEEWDSPEKPVKTGLTASRLDTVDRHKGDINRAEHSPSPGDRDSELTMRTVQDSAALLIAVVSLMPSLTDAVVDRIIEFLDGVRTKERTELSPDDNQRDLILSDSIDSSSFDVFASLWNLLLTCGSARGADAAAEDIISYVRRWVTMQHLRHRLAESYAVDYGYKKRATMPLPNYAERSRCMMLRYLTRYLELHLDGGMLGPAGLVSGSFTRRCGIVEQVLSVAQALCQSTVMNLPRATCEVALRFAATSCKIIDDLLPPDASSGDRDLRERLVELRNTWRSWYGLRLNDDDGAIRLAAAGSIEALFPTRYKAPDGRANLGDMLSSLLPSLALFRSNLDGHGGDRIDISADHRPLFDGHWHLDADDDAVLSGITSAFKTVCAVSQGTTDIVMLSEIAWRVPSFRGNALFELFLKVSLQRCSARIGFGGIVRVSYRSGFRDPDELFRTHCRVVLGSWIGKASTRRPLLSFPAHLVLPGDRRREGAIYDWLSLHASEIIPLVLVMDDANTLGETRELARNLGVDVGELIKGNFPAVYRVYPMHFMSGRNSFARQLWSQIKALSSNASRSERVAEQLDDVICSILMSASAGHVLHGTLTDRNYSLRTMADQFEFRRDCSEVKAPEYDPVVCALALNHIVSSGEASSYVLSSQDLSGSIFAAGKHGDFDLTKIAQRFTRRPVTLALVLAHIWQGMNGPPGPPSVEMRANTFMSLGILFRISRDALFKETTLRFALFDLIAAGFRFSETARNARWLLQEVAQHYPASTEIAGHIDLVDSAFYGFSRSRATESMKNLLKLDSEVEQRWWELLEIVIPDLLSIAGQETSRIDSSVAEFARRTITHLLGIAMEQKVIGAVALLDVLPEGKEFKRARRIQEDAFQQFFSGLNEMSAQQLVEYRLWRIAARRSSFSKHPVALLARLRNLRLTLSKHFTVIEDAACQTSNAQLDTDCVLPRLADEALVALVSILESSTRYLSPQRSEGKVGLRGERRQQLNMCGRNLTNSMFLIKEEAARCIGALGPLCQAPSPSEVVASDDEGGRAKGHRALQCLVLELRSECAISRRLAIQTLPRFLAGPAERELVPLESDLGREFRMFIDAGRRVVKKGSIFTPVVDPDTGHEVDHVLPDLVDDSLWDPKVYDREDDGDVPSRWIRTLSAVLSRHCDPNGCLHLLQAMCYASADFARSLFPDLLAEVVARNAEKSDLISSLGRCIQEGLICNRKCSIGALRMAIQGLDALCLIGVERLRTKGVGRNFFTTGGRRLLSAVDYLYLLPIPYIDVAKASSRCRFYFSAIRFATLHVDSACNEREREFIRTKGLAASDNLRSAVAEAREFAREEASPIIWNALRHVNEPDGPRAVPHSQTLLERAAVLASVESDWSRMLGSYDALQRRSTFLGDVTSVSTSEKRTAFSFARERDIMRSMVGLGALHSVERYWHGLRYHIAAAGSCGKSDEESRNPYEEDTEAEAVQELVEIRYYSAWRLGSWEVPPLALNGAQNRQGMESAIEDLGLHEAIHSSLKALSVCDFEAAFDLVGDARSHVARQIVVDWQNKFGSSAYETACRLRLLDDVEYGAMVLAQCQLSQQAKPCKYSLPNSLLESCSVSKKLTACGGERAQACSRDGKADFGLDAALLPSQADDTQGIIESQLRDEEDLNRYQKEGSLGSRFKIMDAAWRRRDKNLLCSTLRSPRHDSSGVTVEIALSLRLAIARALGLKESLAKMSAELAMAILQCSGAKPAWARAASALGDFDIMFVERAPPLGRAAWLIAQARLRWHAGEDGSAKQEALAAVQKVICNELGGSIVEHSSIGAEPTTESKLRWTRLRDSDDTFEEDVANLRAQACQLVSSWSTSMRADEPMNVFKGYLQLGLDAFRDLNSGSIEGESNGHLAMANFADRQLAAIEKYRRTKEYEFTVESVQKMRRIVETLHVSIVKFTGSKLIAMRKYLKDTAADLERDTRKLERLDFLLREWKMLAAKHYADCLRLGGGDSLRASFRLVSLWLDSGPLVPEIGKIIVPNSVDDVKSLGVPVCKLLPLAPQLASRLTTTRGDEFESDLSVVFSKMTAAYPSHCLWLLIALSNSTKAPPTGFAQGALYRGNMEKKEAADGILANVRKLDRESVEQTLRLAAFYFGVSEISKDLRKSSTTVQLSAGLPRIRDLEAVPVPTFPLPLHGMNSSSPLPHVSYFDAQAQVLGGKSAPLKVSCIGSDGVAYPQVVKYEDDMRQDSVMQQLFAILNELLASSPASAARSLSVRTYRVVPLSPFAGFLQFVRNSQPFKDYLVSDGRTDEQSAHARYRPHDTKHVVILQKAAELRKRPVEVRVRYMRKIWDSFNPVFRYFFLEKFPEPMIWYARRLSYTRSVAVMSIVGWIMGLGDRHLSNILIDRNTAEVIHIDFGIAFEQGKLLPTPEHMPFRLTRDIVDGMGVDGVEGVFRRCCEVTLEVLRAHKDLVLMVIEVFLHDPLYNWSLSPVEIMRQQVEDDRDGDVLNLEEEAGYGFGELDSGLCNNQNNDKAQHALARVVEKLDGLEETERLSVEAHVARLIDQARAFEVLASVYCGWMPHV